MVFFSLLLNILVLIPVCTGLLVNSTRINKTAGEFTPARGVLLAMYMTILIASIILLFFRQSYLVFALLFMQIVYKLLSPITVKTLRNPIVVSNILIAIFHIITIYSMYKSEMLFF